MRTAVAFSQATRLPSSSCDTRLHALHCFISAAANVDLPQPGAPTRTNTYCRRGEER